MDFHFKQIDYHIHYYLFFHLSENTYEFINRNFLFDNLLGIDSLLDICGFNRHNAENYYHMELVNWVKISNIEFCVIVTLREITKVFKRVSYATRVSECSVILIN